MSKAYGRYACGTSIFCINAFASTDTFDQSESENLYSPIFILSKISSSVLPVNGGYPHSKIYNMTPALQMSQR